MQTFLVEIIAQKAMVRSQKVIITLLKNKDLNGDTIIGLPRQVTDTFMLIQLDTPFDRVIRHEWVEHIEIM